MTGQTELEYPASRSASTSSSSSAGTPPTLSLSPPVSTRPRAGHAGSAKPGDEHHRDGVCQEQHGEPGTSSSSSSPTPEQPGSQEDRKPEDSTPTKSKVMVNLQKRQNPNLSAISRGTWPETPCLGSGSPSSCSMTCRGSSSSLGRGEGGRSCQGAPIVMTFNGTLCSQFGNDCRNENFREKTTVAEPEKIRTSREGNMPLICRNGCDWSTKITDQARKTPEQQAIILTHPEEVDEYTLFNQIATIQYLSD